MAGRLSCGTLVISDESRHCLLLLVATMNRKEVNDLGVIPFFQSTFLEGARKQYTKKGVQVKM